MVPTSIIVTWTVPLSRVVMCMTPLAVIVSVALAPVQGLGRATTKVAVKWMVSVSVASAAVGASSAADTVRPISETSSRSRIGTPLKTADAGGRLGGPRARATSHPLRLARSVTLRVLRGVWKGPSDAAQTYLLACGRKRVFRSRVVVVAGRGRPPQAAVRRAGLEDVEKLLTNTIDAANKTALGAVKWTR